MKKICLFTAALATLFILAGCCCIGKCPAAHYIPGTWQLYGTNANSKLTLVPVVMTFGRDGGMTTVINNKEVRKSSWKEEGNYIVISQSGKPTVRLECKGRDRLEFEWKGGKYKDTGLKLVLKKQ